MMKSNASESGTRFLRRSDLCRGRILGRSRADKIFGRNAIAK
jgi:hypothetical protein